MYENLLEYSLIVSLVALFILAIYAFSRRSVISELLQTRSKAFDEIIAEKRKNERLEKFNSSLIERLNVLTNQITLACEQETLHANATVRRMVRILQGKSE